MTNAEAAQYFASLAADEPAQVAIFSRDTGVVDQCELAGILDPADSEFEDADGADENAGLIFVRQ